jgi:hypothetical protein
MADESADTPRAIRLAITVVPGRDVNQFAALGKDVFREAACRNMDDYHFALVR